MSARSIHTKLLATAVVLAALGAGATAVVFSAFTSTAHSAGSTFQAGSIRLTADATGSTLFAMDSIKPGDAQSRCVRVAYAASGGLASAVRLYATTTGSAEHGGLERFLSLRVTRGTFSGAAPAGGACDGFLADTAGGTLFDGALSAYPSSWASGIADPRAAWHDGDAAVYRLDVTARDDDAAQGLDATTEFGFAAHTAS